MMPATSLTRDQSIMMRGFGILSIVLHNYCHTKELAIEENEFSLSYDNVNAFFGEILNFSDTWVYNFFSFLGWYGLPIFWFLISYNT